MATPVRFRAICVIQTPLGKAVIPRLPPSVFDRRLKRWQLMATKTKWPHSPPSSFSGPNEHFSVNDRLG